MAQASLIEGVVPLGFAVAGGLVASRLPSNPVGWLLLATAVLVALSGVAAQLAVHGALVRPGSVPGVPWFAWLADWISAPVFPGGLIPVLFLLFPSGRVVSPRWRAVAWGAVVAGVAFTLVTMFRPSLDNLPVASLRFANPVGVEPFASGGLPDIAALLLGYASLAAAGASLVVRLRSSRGIVRQQLRWVALAVAVTVAASVALVLVGLFLPALALTWVYEVVTVLGFGLAFPVAVSVAILRYRLFDLDRIIRRTLVYTVVSALLASVYAGAVLVLQAFVRAGTGERSDLAVVVSTLAIAALFTPLRRRVQRWVDRRFYGPASMPNGPFARSPSGCATRSYPRSWRVPCWALSRRPCSRSGCRCGCAGTRRWAGPPKARARAGKRTAAAPRGRRGAGGTPGGGPRRARMNRPASDAVVVGSGPDGPAAAVTLARAALRRRFGAPHHSDSFHTSGTQASASRATSA